MPRIAGDTLRKVTLNLYEADVAWMEEHLGRGWSEQVRAEVHSYVLVKRSQARDKFTVRREID